MAFIVTLRIISLPPPWRSTAMRTSADLFTFTSATSNDGGVTSAWLNAGTEDKNNRKALALRTIMESPSLNHTDQNMVPTMPRPATSRTPGKQQPCPGRPLRQTGIDELHVHRSEGKRLIPHVGKVPDGPPLLHDPGGRMPVDALQKMYDLVDHHMGKHRTGTPGSFNAIEEYGDVSALVGQGIR